jgi:hypothetical protein
MTTNLIVIALLAVIAWAFLAARADAGKPGKRAATAGQLNARLAGTPMEGTGYMLERAGWRHGIHPALIAAIAGTESSFGRAACRSNRYNAFGLASCGTSWRVPDFRSWAQAYQFMGRFLKERWPHARTPYDYRGYAACTPCWARKTAGWMRWLGFPAAVAYGRRAP